MKPLLAENLLVTKGGKLALGEGPWHCCTCANGCWFFGDTPYSQNFAYGGAPGPSVTISGGGKTVSMDFALSRFCGNSANIFNQQASVCAIFTVRAPLEISILLSGAQAFNSGRATASLHAVSRSPSCTLNNSPIFSLTPSPPSGLGFFDCSTQAYSASSSRVLGCGNYYIRYRASAETRDGYHEPHSHQMEISFDDDSNVYGFSESFCSNSLFACIPSSSFRPAYCKHPSEQQYFGDPSSPSFSLTYSECVSGCGSPLP